jgi:hypothetical protein
VSPPNKDPIGFVQATRDRADTIVDVVIGFATDALRDFVNDEPVNLRDVRRRAAAFVRGEIADIERKAAGERIAGLD